MTTTTTLLLRLTFIAKVGYGDFKKAEKGNEGHLHGGIQDSRKRLQGQALGKGMVEKLWSNENQH